MRTFDRKELLDDLEFSSAWKTVKEWIREMAIREPRVMRKVSEARFGDLGMWIQKGRGNVSVCGCLVGTTAIELTKDRNHFKPDAEKEGFICTTPIEDWVTPKMEDEAQLRGDWSLSSYAGAPQVVEALIREEMSVDADRAGIAAAGLQNELGQDAAVWLIKDEIRRQLGFQRQRVRAAKKAVKSVGRNKKTGQFKRVA